MQNFLKMHQDTRRLIVRVGEISKKFGHFKGGQSGRRHAMNWARKYFGGGPGEGTGYKASAQVTSVGGRNYVTVTKTRYDIDDEDQMGEIYFMHLSDNTSTLFLFLITNIFPNIGDMSSEDKVVDPEIQPKGIFVNEEGIRLDKPASYACAPEDWETNSKYHPINVAIWRAWIRFYKVISTLKTKSGKPIDPSLIIGPALNWSLKPGEKIWCPYASLFSFTCFQTYRGKTPGTRCECQWRTYLGNMGALVYLPW